MAIFRVQKDAHDKQALVFNYSSNDFTITNIASKLSGTNTLLAVT